MKGLWGCIDRLFNVRIQVGLVICGLLIAFAGGSFAEKWFNLSALSANKVRGYVIYVPTASGHSRVIRGLDNRKLEEEIFDRNDALVSRCISNGEDGPLYRCSKGHEQAQVRMGNKLSLICPFCGDGAVTSEQGKADNSVSENL